MKARHDRASSLFIAIKRTVSKPWLVALLFAVILAAAYWRNR